MDFNVKKFSVLELGRNTDIKLEYNYIVPGFTQVITDNDTVRDISVIVNSEANYNNHISKIYSKITQQAGLLLRTVENISLSHMRFLWRTYLEPLLNYSSQLYSSSSGGSLVRLESLLESFSAKIEGLDNISYWSSLKELKTYSITRRFE